ncbi:MAG: hypothetical protein Q8P32_02080 [Candidatus Komeilibacteria bacterium]|nr:hypothetical protein [Candidatus Komeilibacteria bacterium]
MIAKIIVLIISLIVLLILLQNQVSIWWFIGFLVITLAVINFIESD